MNPSEKLDQIHRGIEHYIEIGRFEAARARLSEAFAIAPEDPETHLLASRVASGLGDVDTARRHAEAVIAARPDDPDAKMNLSEVYSEAGEFVASERLLIEVLRDNPDLEDGFAAYSLLMFQTHHMTKARALAQEALRISQDNQLATALLLLIDLIEDRSEIAKDRMSTLIFDDPDNLNILHIAVIFLTYQNRYHEALDIAREILRQEPEKEDAVSMVAALKAETHWSLAPYWPMRRFGLLGAGVVWVLYVIGLFAFGLGTDEMIQTSFLLLVCYVGLSWLHPYLLRLGYLLRGA